MESRKILMTVASRRRFLVFAFISFIFNLSAEDQASPGEYVPKSGQPGKDVVWVPNPSPMVEKLLDMATVTPQDYVIDLGSGDGRNVIAAAKRGARAHGIEYDRDLVELSKRNAAKEVSATRRLLRRAIFSQATSRKPP
jgi:protein-L-isoaspartate O-methyltransferase